MSRINAVIYLGLVAAYKSAREAPILDLRVKLPSAPNKKLVDRIFEFNLGDNFVNIADLFKSIGNIVPLTIATCLKIKGNQINLIPNNLQHFHLMSTIAMQIQYGWVFLKIFLKHNH